MAVYRFPFTVSVYRLPFTVYRLPFTENKKRPLVQDQQALKH
jgi:hypothetical protein